MISIRCYMILAVYSNSTNVTHNNIPDHKLTFLVSNRHSSYTQHYALCFGLY